MATAGSDLVASLEHGQDQVDAVQIGAVASSRHKLVEEARELAGVLASQGTAPVAVHGDVGLQTVRTVVACLLAGRPVVPVPPDAGESERRHIVTNSGASLWVGPSTIDVPVQGFEAVASSQPSAWDAPTNSDTAVILYTSGTTGPPKGVPLTHGTIAAGIDALAEAWDWTPDDILAHGLPLFHAHGLILGVLGALHVGSRFRHTGKPTADAYAEAQASLYFAVPTIWGRVLQAGSAAGALRSARLLVSGSAPLAESVFEGLHEASGHRVVERYGMTETLVTLSSRADGERRPGWVGQVVRGAQARVVDEAGGVVDSDGQSIGSLQVRGPMVFQQYLDLAEATSQAWTTDGWFRTGDAAVVDAAGCHRIIGRESSDIVKSGGFKIGTGEVEATLREHPDVVEASVIGVPDADLGERLVAHVVSGGLSTADELIDHVATQLSWHKRPREVRFIDELPRNAMGKVVKAVLREGHT